MSRRHPPARSPTPPSRVIKSTYGGNLFTAEDVLYLKKYIDYCQEQGLVLRFVLYYVYFRDIDPPIYSLREICERIAVKVSSRKVYNLLLFTHVDCSRHRITRTSVVNRCSTCSNISQLLLLASLLQQTPDSSGWLRYGR